MQRQRSGAQEVARWTAARARCVQALTLLSCPRMTGLLGRSTQSCRRFSPKLARIRVWNQGVPIALRRSVTKNVCTASCAAIAAVLLARRAKVLESCKWGPTQSHTLFALRQVTPLQAPVNALKHGHACLAVI